MAAPLKAFTGSEEERLGADDKVAGTTGVLVQEW